MGNLQNVDNTDIDETAVQYIVVKLGDEQYGIGIKYIDNIVRCQEITRVPKTQIYYKGIINLRGEIIPIMSMRLRLNLESDEITNKTRIIILKIDNAKVGLIVDEVKEVISLGKDNLEKIDKSSGYKVSDYISEIGKNNGELISIVDVISIVSEK